MFDATLKGGIFKNEYARKVCQSVLNNFSIKYYVFTTVTIMSEHNAYI